MPAYIRIYRVRAKYLPSSVCSGVLRTGSSQNQLRFSDFLHAYISVIEYTIKLHSKVLLNHDLK